MTIETEDRAQGQPGPNPVAPVVTLSRIRQIRTFEVMDTDLEALDAATRREQSALTFFTLCLGMLVPTVVAALTSSALGDLAVAIYSGATVALGVLTLYLGHQWWIARRERPAILARIRESYIVVVDPRGAR